MREREREKREKGEKKPTWLAARGMSAASRLVAIHYPSLLKYYAHWLMLTVWPEGGECVGKRVCLHLSPTVSNPISVAEVLQMAQIRTSWGFLRQMLKTSIVKINKGSTCRWASHQLTCTWWITAVQAQLMGDAHCAPLTHDRPSSLRKTSPLWARLVNN